MTSRDLALLQDRYGPCGRLVYFKERGLCNTFLQDVRLSSLEFSVQALLRHD